MQLPRRPLTPEEHAAAVRRHAVHLRFLQITSWPRGGWETLTSFATLNGREFRVWP